MPSVNRLTLRVLSEIAREEVGAKPGTPLDTLDLANQAGELLCNAHPWGWLEGRSVTIRPRAAITLTGAAWTEATLTLTQVGAFASYVRLEGDVVEITAGTGAVEGTYAVASRVDDDSITLSSSIGAPADGQTDIEAFMANDQVELPGGLDIRQITAYGMTSGLVGVVEPISPQGLLDARAWPGPGNTIGFWFLLRHVRATTGQPVQRLELWPATTDTSEALVLFYRAGWAEPQTDEEVLNLPPWLTHVYLELFKAVVMANEEPENGSLMRRTQEVFRSDMWFQAVALDATMQPEVGPMVNGWMSGTGRGVDRFDVPPPMVVP